MNFMRQMVLGNNLTKLANIIERIEASGATRYIGSGYGFESLPQLDQQRVAAEFKRRMTSLSKHPPYVITGALKGHMELSIRSGREHRLNGQGSLYEILVENGIALSVDDYESIMMSQGNLAA